MSQFKFIHCVHPEFTKLDYGYVLVLSSLQEVLNWGLKDDTFKDAYIDFTKNVKVVDGHDFGHCQTDTGCAAMAFAGLRGESFLSSLNGLAKSKMEGILKLVGAGKKVYVQRNGSYMIGATEISEPIMRDSLDFPEKGSTEYTEDDIKITRWPGGNHYYGKVGSHEIEGQKCCSVKACEEACMELLKELNAQGEQQ